MKNLGIKLACVMSLAFLVTSCNTDDNGGETLVPLTGKWKISQVGTIVGDTETLIDAPQNESGCEKDYMELKMDNTVIEGNYDSTITTCALTTRDGIYSRSHNNITKVIDGVETVQDIANLTINELKLKDASGNVEVYTR